MALGLVSTTITTTTTVCVHKYHYPAQELLLNFRPATAPPVDTKVLLVLMERGRASLGSETVVIEHDNIQGRAALQYQMLLSVAASAGHILVLYS